MKTLKTQNSKIKKPFVAFVLLLMFAGLSTSLSAQTETVAVKGMITSKIGPLDGVNIYLKNSSVGTVSKSNGSFAFREKLNIGDVIIFSYLGYVKQSVTITNEASALEIFMEEAPIDVLSAPNSNKPYKSKRPQHRQ